MTHVLADPPLNAATQARTSCSPAVLVQPYLLSHLEASHVWGRLRVVSIYVCENLSDNVRGA
jgi:hypothetical protein